MGSIVIWFTNIIPNGYLLCDGASFSQVTYPDLYAVLGNVNTTPDLRGYFLRGLNTSATVDPNGGSRTIGSI